MYRKWNFFVRYYNKGLVKEDCDNLVTANYDSYIESVGLKSLRVFLIDHFFYFVFMPTFIWWKFTPFKFKWPKEIEVIFGKINYY